MNAAESRAEVFLMALQSLSKAERKAVVAHLLEDSDLLEDILDIVLVRQRQEETSRPLAEYLNERNSQVRTG